jgi:hypothetical protein
LDTSMGLTPLAGLPGATRSGSVDPRYVLEVGEMGTTAPFLYCDLDTDNGMPVSSFTTRVMSANSRPLLRSICTFPGLRRFSTKKADGNP